MEKKLLYLDSFASSKLLFGQGVWTRSDLLRRMDASYMSALRAATAKPKCNEDAATNLEVLVEAERLPIATQSALCRLASLGRVVNIAPECVHCY